MLRQKPKHVARNSLVLFRVLLNQLFVAHRYYVILQFTLSKIPCLFPKLVRTIIISGSEVREVSKDPHHFILAYDGISLRDENVYPVKASVIELMAALHASLQCGLLENGERVI